MLLQRIAALRQRLGQTQTATLHNGPATDSDEATRIQQLEQQISLGGQEIALLNTALKKLSPGTLAVSPDSFPKQLTARARQALERSGELLNRLRQLADRPTVFPEGEGNTPTATNDLNSFDARYDQTAAMVELVIRMIQALPDAPSAQARLTEGIEALLAIVAERVAVLDRTVAERRRQEEQIDTLADFLTRLHQNGSAHLSQLDVITAETIAGAQSGSPLRFLSAPAETRPRFVAAHSLTVAAVAARVARHDPEFRKDLHRVVRAALLHDAGMLHVPVEILARPAALADGERRIIEAHTRVGAEMLARLSPSSAWLAETAAGHHERLDGTGYPAGLREHQMPSLTRLIAVCDVYAALAVARPHRTAFDTRTALTDTLLLAEKGLLDRYHAERLLQLSFYPVGSVVELADGAIGVVVATHLGWRDVSAPARPVLALLTDSQGRSLPSLNHLDLAQCENRSIVRALKPGERSELLDTRYPEFV
jgi:putative nucleotidyltransferase with HDIG domain